MLTAARDKLLQRGNQVQCQAENQRYYAANVVTRPYMVDLSENELDPERFGTNVHRVVCRYMVCVCVYLCVQFNRFVPACIVSKISYIRYVCSHISVCTILHLDGCV
jgi:hypothetical protein